MVGTRLSHKRVATMANHKRRPARTMATPPRPLHIDPALLATIRAAYPVARDWTDTQITAGCVALALTMATRRIGTVHTD